MMFKRLLSRAALAAVVVGALAMGASTAQAKTNIHIWIGIPGFTYWDGPGYYGGVYRHRLTCGEGRWIVDHRRFNLVRAIDCWPRTYHYRALRYGQWYIVGVDSWTGRIVSVEPY